MQFITLGRTDEIGASSHYLLIDGVGIVLDAGVDPEEEGRASLPDLRQIRDRGGRPVDHVIITHAHHDHLGSLPVLMADHPNARLHVTAPTRALAEVLLPSSARLQRRKLYEGSTTAQPLFDVETAEALSYLYEEHDLEEPFDLASPAGSVKAALLHAGHTLGSAGVLLEGEGRRVFFTGDTHAQDQVILPGAVYPEGPIDVLLLETTLGADEEAEHTSRKQEERRLGEAIARVIERGGSVMLPSFALGRAQEMLALVDRFKRRGLIPQETPVYTAGQMRAVAEIFDATRYSSPRRDTEFKVYDVQQHRTPRSDAALRRTLDEPCIHIASSGMLFERTLSNVLAQMMIEDERNGIFFVGYSVEHAPGAKLQEAAKAGEPVVLDTQLLGENDGPKTFEIRAEVERFRFSGHSNRQELLDLVEHVDPKKVVLVHGEADARAWFEAALAEEYPEITVINPKPGEVVEL